MLTRKPFFRGDHPHHQLACIVEKLGCPSPEDMAFVTNPSAKKAVMGAGEAKVRPLTDFLPRGVNSQAVDLLQKMLIFAPEKRITVDQALGHEYLRELHSQMKEPECGAMFDSEVRACVLRGAKLRIERGGYM